MSCRGELHSLFPLRETMTITRLAWVLLPVCIGFAPVWGRRARRARARAHARAARALGSRTLRFPRGAQAPRSTAAWLRRAPVARGQADADVPSLDDAPSDGSVRIEDGPMDATAVLTFALTGEHTRLAMRAAATHIANTTTIDGWRKSDAKKVPPEVVGAVVGKLALHKCCLDVLEGEVTKAIERSGVKAIGQPALVGDKDVYAADKLAAGEPLALKIVVGQCHPDRRLPRRARRTRA